MLPLHGRSGDSVVPSNSIVDAAARYRSLVETLPHEHHELFLSCCDGEALLDGVKALDVLKDGKRVRHLERIQSVVRSFEPMFAALDVFCQVDPIHFATVWGGVRVLVQLTANFLNFYDKLTESLNSMSRALDYFRRVHTHNLTSGSQRLSALLESVFAEVLDFLTSVMRIFHTSEGKVKSRVRTYAGAAFKPFRFDQVINRMREYQSAVVAELVLLQAIGPDHGTKSLEEEPESLKLGIRPYRNLGPEITEALIGRIRGWLTPTLYSSRYQEASELRKGNTTGWIFEQPAYQSWRTSQQESSMLWIHGKPGSGNPVLAAALVDHEKATSSSSKAAYSAILSQILQKHSANVKLIDMFRFSMYFATDGQPTSSTLESGDLLELCLQLPELEDSVLILDGLDECQDVAKDLVHRLNSIKLQTRVKTVMLGRSSIQGALKALPKLISIQIGALNLDDIQLYLRSELSGAVDNDLLPMTLNLNDVAGRLSRRADGMFLWARLMMVYLNSPGLLVSERLEAISDIDMPEGLERMYERILRQMAKAGKTSLRLACHVFMCLVYARRELTSRELEDSVVSRKKGGIDEPSRSIPNFSDSVLSICGGFVEQHSPAVQNGQSMQPSFRFIHASVKEYFRTEPQRKSDGEAVLKDVILVPLPLAGNSRLAAQALEYVVHALPKDRIQSASTPKAELLVTRPFSQYVTINWPHHVLAANGDAMAVQEAYVQEPMAYAELISALCQILSSPSAISAWVQSCYVFQHEPPVSTLLDWVDKCSRPNFSWRKHFPQINDIIPEMQSLAAYLRRVITEWGTHLWRDPSCIWEEVGAFAPSAFILSPRGITVRNLVSRKPALHLSDEPIHKVSQLMPDGKLDFVLSVFSTREFVESASSRATQWDNDCFECLQYSTGWNARLEVFSIEECERVGCLEISLEENEVRLQIFQTMMCSSSGGTLQLPLSLGQDGRFFTVLKTLYRLHGEVSSFSYTADKIPVEITDANKSSFEVPTQGSWFPDPRSLYLYWIYFDDGGRYLCSVEQIHSTPLLVSVFDFEESGTRPLKCVARSSISLPSPRDLYYPGRQKREFELAFHPYLPLLALAGTSGTFIWDFTPEFKHEGPVKLRSYWGDDDDEKGKVEMVSFSSDGDYCITKRRGHLPTILNVEKQIAVSKQLQDRAVDGDSADLDSREMISILHASSLTTCSSSSATIRGGSRALAAHEKSAGEVILTNSGGEVNLSSWSGEGARSSKSLTLTRIPHLPGSKAIVPGVVLPSTSGDPVKIVLDKGSTTANRINATQVQSTYPTVVERHISSIQRSQQAQSMELRAREPLLAISEPAAHEEDASFPFSSRDQNDRNEVSSRSYLPDVSFDLRDQVPPSTATSITENEDPSSWGAVLQRPTSASNPPESVPSPEPVAIPEPVQIVVETLSSGPSMKNTESHKMLGKKRGWSLKKFWKRAYKA